MKNEPLLCTPAVVGILTERGLTVDEIAKKVNERTTLVERYLRRWRQATDFERDLARLGTIKLL
jgi:transposase